MSGFYPDRNARIQSTLRKEVTDVYPGWALERGK
jgi:hypothetical protein